MTEQQILSELKQTLGQLDDNFDDLYALAQTPAEKAALRDRLTGARDAYWIAINRGLKDLNGFVNDLAADLRTQNEMLAKQIAGLQNFAGLLIAATEAVKLAASIATLAAAA